MLQSDDDDSLKSYDPKIADIWTCGIMLYVFATACLPFDHENHAKLYNLIKSSKYQWPSHVTVSPGIQNLVAKILQADPTMRPTIEEIKADEWFKVTCKCHTC